jgi:hypothetical protein
MPPVQIRELHDRRAVHFAGEIRQEHVMMRHLDGIGLDIPSLDNGRGADPKDRSGKAQKKTARGKTALDSIRLRVWHHKTP